VGWGETEDPFQLCAGLLKDALGGATVHRVGVADRMWAMHALALGAALPDARLETAGTVLSELRMVKSPAEVEALRAAGEAIDRVHEQLPGWRWVGRTEREVGRDIAEAIVAEGHQTVNFVIVASGPNGASPHHDTGDRRIQRGDVVVVDIGGTTADGYCSDSTRTYVVGSLADAPDDFGPYYRVLREAQETSCAAVAPGVSCEAVDAAARDLIAAAGYGDFFVHRTGHGIGLEEHEEPYIVAGNSLPLRPGMAFSIEPGIYLPGRHGARIEDIVVCTDTGVDLLNRTPRDLVVVDS
jgi:Xaa-Pro aminopeptidase